MEIILQTLQVLLPSLLTGIELTIASAIICGILALAIAIPVGLGRASNSVIIRSLCTFYVETIRGTPLLFQLFVWVFATNIVLIALFNFNINTAFYNLLTALNSNTLYPSAGVSAFFLAAFGLAVNYGAYLAEVVRAGVQAVEPGQTEAALSLGMSRFQVARYVVLPQAFRIMIPPLTNNFITLIQDTTFFQVFGVWEISQVIQTAVQATSSPTIRWTLYAVELAVFFVLCYSLATVSRRTEQRLARTMAGAH